MLHLDLGWLQAEPDKPRPLVLRNTLHVLCATIAIVAIRVTAAIMSKSVLMHALVDVLYNNA
eukprot:1158964-Pelagomonas_calceolata.AAC.3